MRRITVCAFHTTLQRTALRSARALTLRTLDTNNEHSNFFWCLPETHAVICTL